MVENGPIPDDDPMTNEPSEPDDPATSGPDPAADAPTVPMDAEAATAGDPTFADTTTHQPDDPTGDVLPPPPQTSAPVRTGLVRDPYSRLGGIASGIAHRYGWDPTLVRLAFVIGLVASFGTAFFVYLVAWVVIPRATVWPPTPVRDGAGGFSNREAGIGIAVAGVLAFLIAGTGAAGAVLVPLALVGGGIWLLVQQPRTVAVDDAAGTTSTLTAGPATRSATPATVDQPVPPRSRRRKWAVRALVAATVLTVLAAIVVPVTVAALWIGRGDGVSVSMGNDHLRFSNYAPRDLGGLPSAIRSDNGLARVDLTKIPAADFAERAEPTRLDIAIGDGEAWLELPDGLSYRLDANAERGTVHTRGRVLHNGKTDRHTVQIHDPDPDIVITVDVGKGDINLEQH